MVLGMVNPAIYLLLPANHLRRPLTFENVAPDPLTYNYSIAKAFDLLECTTYMSCCDEVPSTLSQAQLIQAAAIPEITSP